MRVAYRQAAKDDVIRQFRYYLLADDLPEIAVRFREAVQRTVNSLRRNPQVGPRYTSEKSGLANLRSWPVTGFEAIRIYYLFEEDTLKVIRVLHSKRDVRKILEAE